LLLRKSHGTTANINLDNCSAQRKITRTQLFILSTSFPTTRVVHHPAPMVPADTTDNNQLQYEIGTGQKYKY
jgi:hypothetical protein